MAHQPPDLVSHSAPATVAGIQQGDVHVETISPTRQMADTPIHSPGPLRSLHRMAATGIGSDDGESEYSVDWIRSADQRPDVVEYVLIIAPFLLDLI